MTGAAPLSQVIIWPGIERLTLISGGEPVDNSAELLSANQMRRLVHELKHRYDDRMVIFDAPPLLGCADTLALLPLVDGVVVVVAESMTTLHDLGNALETVPKDKLIGLVMNRQKKTAFDKYE